MGKQPKDIFAMLDRDKTGTVSTEEFVKGLKLYLDLWLQPSEITNLLNYIDEESTGAIDYNEFVDKIGFLT